MSETAVKRCPDCDTSKPLEDFHRNRARSDGRQGICRVCVAVRDGRRVGTRNDEARERSLRRRYGIGVIDLDAMVVDQAGHCLICQQVSEDLVIDHCHRSGVVRGLLCRRCNLGLGYFDDDPSVARGAMRYLQERNVNIMDEAHGDEWVLYNGDSCEVLPSLPDHSVGLSVFSPPFSSTYTYSPSDRDLGNVSSDQEFWSHFGFISSELLRVMQPGRLVAVHVANLPMYEIRDGASGRKDFRGDTIRHFIDAGFIYHSEICIDKNPQAQAIRTHSKGLLFVQLNRDAAFMWQAWADYVCVFRAPGKNDQPVHTDLSQEEWIEYARPIWPAGGGPELDQTSAEWSDALVSQAWYGIRETDVLSTHQARDNDDERHLCPLQLPVIERCVRLWSNEGDVVLSPFAGIGSEGVGALRLGRRFVGVELKPSYFKVASENLRSAEGRAQMPSFLEVGA